MTHSYLKDRQCSYSSKWNNQDNKILVRKPELDFPSLQGMEEHLQTSMEVWVDDNNKKKQHLNNYNFNRYIT